MLGLMIFNKIITNKMLVDTKERLAAIDAQKSPHGAMRATLQALPALLMPVVILGGIYGGVFTPTEAAAVALFMAILIGFFG